MLGWGIPSQPPPGQQQFGYVSYIPHQSHPQISRIAGMDHSRPVPAHNPPPLMFQPGVMQPPQLPPSHGSRYMPQQQQVMVPMQQQQLHPQDPRRNLPGWTSAPSGMLTNQPTNIALTPQGYTLQAAPPDMHHLPGVWWKDIKSAGRLQDGGEEFWQTIFTDQYSSVMQPSPYSSGHPSNQVIDSFQRLALELQKATKEDLCERIKQLKLTRDLLVTRNRSDEQDKKDADLLARKIRSAEHLLATMNGEKAAGTELKQEADMWAAERDAVEAAKRGSSSKSPSAPRIITAVPVGSSKRGASASGDDSTGKVIKETTEAHAKAKAKTTTSQGNDEQQDDDGHEGGQTTKNVYSTDAADGNARADSSESKRTIVPSE